jgi:hypothetical protein
VANQLVDEEGVPLGLRVDCVHVARPIRRGVRVREQAANELARVLLGERIEVHSADFARERAQAGVDPSGA